jgi:hypothetical protein
MYRVLLLTLVSLALIGFYSLQAQVSITESYRVLDGSDDAEEKVNDGSIDLGSTDLELTMESSEQIIGIRFANIQIPQGATINNAFIQFAVDETDNAPTDLVFHGELVPNSTTFTPENFNISSRPLTNASVNWDMVPVWDVVNAAGPDQQTPDLSLIVSEIVSQDNWSIGNALSIIISGTGKRTSISRNKDEQLSAVLVVNYEVTEFPIQNYPIREQSLWRYDDTDTPLDTVNWTELEFDDSSWAFGQGKFGYGDGDENTTLDFGADPDLKTPTYYFRKVFNVEDPSSIDSISLNILRDDGAVVYINGREVMRTNMPDGPIDFNTLAVSAIAGADESVYNEFRILPNFDQGLNVIAVELHQASLNSSDIGFDLSTSAEVKLPPAIQVIHNASDPSLSLVSVFVDPFNTGNFINFTGSTPFPFRAATEFLTELPAGTHGLAIAPFGTNDFEWSATTITIEDNKRYVVVATGVRDPSMFESTVNSESDMAFNLLITEVPQRSEIEADEAFLVMDHGVTDLPNVRLIAPGVGDATADLPTGLPLNFILIGGGVPAFDFPLVLLTDNTAEEVFSEHSLPLASRAGQVFTVLVSGFFTAEGDPISDANFGVFYVPEEGGFFLPLDAPIPAQPGSIEIIHDSPDPDLSEVDIYVNGDKAISNLRHRSSTGRIPIPAGEVRVAVSPGGTVVDTAWSAVTIFIDSDINPNTLLIEGFDYTAAAFGARNTVPFENPNNPDVSFGLALADGRTETTDSANTDFIVFHGGIDAPMIDIYVDGQFVPLVNDISFGQFSGTYVSLPANNLYQINLTDPNDNATIIKAYRLDLTGLEGTVLTLFASGQLLPEDPDFGLYVTGNTEGPGDTLEEVILSSVSDLRGVGIEIFPNPTSDFISLKSESHEGDWYILDGHGRTILKQPFVSGHLNSINIGHLPAGSYLIRIEMDGNYYATPIIKK